MNDLELLGEPVHVVRTSSTPKQGIWVHVHPDTRVSVSELYDLLCQMASSHSFVQSRFGGHEPTDTVDDLITPNLWESKWDEVLP